MNIHTTPQTVGTHNNTHQYIKIWQRGSCPEFKDAYEHASLTFESAKKALLVIAGVNVALEYSGDAQSTEAKKLVDNRWADLPKALLAVLKMKVAAPDTANSEPK